MKGKNIFGTVSLIVIGIIVGVVLVSNLGLVKPSYANIQIGADKAPVEKISIDADKLNNAFVEVAEKVTPSIVLITVISKVENKIPNNPFHDFFFQFEDKLPNKRKGSGSGVIISDEGYILTNNHVVNNATDVEVTLKDKRHFRAKIIGTDPLTDLAVIKIDADDLVPAYIGNSDKLRIGEWVMAIGNPLSFTSTVTAGIVSARGRNLNIIKASKGNTNYAVENFIQTDAVINPGNSGGALVDLSGAVIGINTAIATNGMTASYIGYGFAIPINLAKHIAEDLIEFGKVVRGYIGVSITDVDDATAKAMGLDKAHGVLIQGIQEGSAASKVDIQPGDIILKIDGKEVNASNQLQSHVFKKRAGDKVKLLLFRDGKEIIRTVKLKALDKEAEDILVDKKSSSDKSVDVDKNEVKFDNLGLTVENLTSHEKEVYKVKNGILISNVERYSPADNQRLFRGLVITHANKKEIKKVTDFQKIVNSKKGDAILLRIVDKSGTARFVGIEIPK